MFKATGRIIDTNSILSSYVTGWGGLLGSLAHIALKQHEIVDCLVNAQVNDSSASNRFKSNRAYKAVPCEAILEMASIIRLSFYSFALKY
jgi:hypothetical protein